MAHSTAVSVVAASVRHAGRAHDLLYKADHPRVIDRYIDFFGDGAVRETADDRCGELFLESLA